MGTEVNHLLCFMASVALVVADGPYVDSITCSPALEGTDQHINVSWDTTKQVTIRKNGSNDMVAVCQPNKKCQPFLDSYSYSDTSTTGETSRMTITVKNVTIRSVGQWSLHVGKKKLLADCKVVAFDREIRCEKRIIPEGIRIICFAHKVFPEVVCLVAVNYTAQTSMWGPKSIGPTHTPIPPSLIYSNASCSTLIPWNDVTLPHVHVDFTMYPNATGAPTDAELGTRARFTFDFDISVQCPPAHEGGTSHLTIIWNNMTSLRVDRDYDTTVISCAALGACGDELPAGYSRTVATRTDGRTQLTLLTHNATRHGSKNAAINWVIRVPNTPKQVRAECKIFERSVSTHCNNTVSTSGVYITCSAKKIFPEGRCLIKSTKEMERAVLPESIHYHLELPKSSFYYDTTCRALVPWALIDPQRPNVSVIIYPNVTGRDTDSTYGSYLFIQIHAEGPSVVLEQCPSKVERGLNANCTCVSTSDNASVFWNSSEHGHGVSVLTFDANTLKVFQCQGRSSEGFLGVANTYKPHISYPPVVGGLNGHADNSSSNDDLPGTDLHIKCEVENNTSVSVRLEKHDEPISWLHEDNAGLWERNKRKCEESQYYECVVTGDDWTKNENFVTSVECLKHDTVLDSSTSSSGGVVAAVICIIIVIGLVVAGVIIVYRVKPPFVVRLLRPTTGADSHFVDVTEDTYQPRGMTYTTSKSSPFQHDVDDNTYQPPPPVDAAIKAKEAIKPKPSHDYDSPSSIPVAYEYPYSSVKSTKSQRDDSGYITPRN